MVIQNDITILCNNKMMEYLGIANVNKKKTQFSWRNQIFSMFLGFFFTFGNSDPAIGHPGLDCLEDVWSREFPAGQRFCNYPPNLPTVLILI